MALQSENVFNGSVFLDVIASFSPFPTPTVTASSPSTLSDRGDMPERGRETGVLSDDGCAGGR